MVAFRPSGHRVLKRYMNGVNLRILLTVLAFLISFAVTSHADGISVSQSLDRTSIGYADSAIFEITVQWDGSQGSYLFPGPLSPEIERLKTRGFTSSIKSQIVDGQEVTTKKHVYTLVPTASGLARINPVTITYLSWPDSLPGELVTEAMTLSIGPPPSPKEEDSGSSIWFWVLLAAIAVAVEGTILVRKWRKAKTVEPVKTPEGRFLDELSALKAEAGSDLKKFQTGLYRILGSLVQEKYGVNPSEASEADLPVALRNAGLAEVRVEKIAGWLIRAQKAKYSPVEAAPGETIRLESEIRTFFEDT